MWKGSEAVFAPTNDYEDFKKSDYDKLGTSIYEMDKEERDKMEFAASKIWEQLEECWKVHREIQEWTNKRTTQLKQTMDIPSAAKLAVEEANKKYGYLRKNANSQRDLIIAEHPDILVPPYVSELKYYMFSGCDTLRSIYITHKSKEVEFLTCNKLKVAVIPHDLELGKHSFPLHTKVIRDKDPEVIQKRRNEKYLAEQAEQKRRNEKYWAEHTDEKQRLDAERASLINENKSLQEQVITFNKKITSLKDMCNGAVPSQMEKDKILNEISALRKEYTHLGLFKGKQKKALQNKIDELNLKISDLDSLIKAEEIEKEKQQKSCSDKIKEIEEHLKPVKDRTTAIGKRIVEINAELTKNR